MKKTESGRSMIEMVGVLAMVGLLAAGAFVLITSAMQSQKISRVQDDVVNIVSIVRNMSVDGKDFSNLADIKDVKAGKVFLDKLHIATSTPFGADSYYSVVYNPQYPDVVGVYINNIDAKYCNALNVGGFKDAVAGGCGADYSSLVGNVKQLPTLESVNVAEKVSAISVKNNFFAVFYKK